MYEWILFYQSIWLIWRLVNSLDRLSLISYLFLFTTIYFGHVSAHSYAGLCGTLYLDFNRTAGLYNICHHSNLNPALDNKVSSIYIPAGYNMRLFQGA